MADVYSRSMMKVALAKMLQTIGWNSINSTPLEILTDIMAQYVIQIAKSTHDYANEFGCADPSLDHLGLAFRDFHVNLQDLEEYVTYVNFAPAPTPVPKYPVPKDDNLNFLKPGSKEVITRPVHIHEHLPPMLQSPEVPEFESPTPVKTEVDEETLNVESSSPVFKRPADVSPGDTFKRPRLNEEEGRPTREISSVMMTTSGYISPAREGKLPESRTPIPAVEPVPPRAITPPPPPVTVSTKVPVTATALPLAAGDTKEAITHLPVKQLDNLAPPAKIKTPNSKKGEKGEKKKASKELFKNGTLPEEVVKKPEKVKKPPKEPKIRKKQDPHGTPKKVPQDKTKAGNTTPKVNKALAAARLKTEKLNTTITPIINKIDKLSNEPDKKKANIFKKISNVKNDKDVKPIKFEGKSPENITPDLIIDEPVDSKLSIPSDVTIELVNAAPNIEKQEQLYFDDSPPGTPSTPKTPEMIVHPTPTPDVVKEKRKRKDKTKVKKLLKPSSPIEMELERPKTPEAHVPSIAPPPAHFPQFSSFPAFPGVPGLSCPPQLINPFIPINPMNPNPFFGLNSSLPPFMPRPGFPIMPPIPPKQEISNVEVSKSKVPADSTSMDVSDSPTDLQKGDITKKKKDKKDKIKKKNKKDKLKNKGEKKKLKEEKKDKIKKEKKEKRKEKEREGNNLKLTLKIGGESSPRPDTPEKKLNIKPIVKREDASSSVEIKREMSPELAKISALVTGQPKPKLSPVVQANNISSESFHLHVKKSMFKPNPSKIRPKEPKQEPAIDETHVTSTVKSKYIDSDGNEVWICPACGRQDDGSPMIGCDDCDAWYHWVCVGIQVPPDETENWYCRQCIVKKQEVLHTDKKKKRKKKEKKEH